MTDLMADAEGLRDELVAFRRELRRFPETGLQLTGSEDFSHVLNEVPGAFLMLGADPGGSVEMNHSPRAAFAELSVAEVAP